MKVRWSIEDGFACGRREYETDVDDDELKDCETQEEREQLIYEVVDEHFRELVTWHEVRREGGPPPIGEAEEEDDEG